MTCNIKVKLSLVVGRVIGILDNIILGTSECQNPLDKIQYDNVSKDNQQGKLQMQHL